MSLMFTWMYIRLFVELILRLTYELSVKICSSKMQH
jgi:hypothetical protein